MTADYLKMMWRRIDFLRSVLEMGYNFVFTVTIQTRNYLHQLYKQVGGSPSFRVLHFFLMREYIIAIHGFLLNYLIF